MHGVKEETEPPFYLNDIVNVTEVMECAKENCLAVAIPENSPSDVEKELQKVTCNTISLTSTNLNTVEIQNVQKCGDIQSTFNRNDNERFLKLPGIFFNDENESTLTFSTLAIRDILLNTKLFFGIENNLDHINNSFLLNLYEDVKSSCWLKSVDSTSAITDGSEMSSSELKLVLLKEKLRSSSASVHEHNALYVELPSTSNLQKMEFEFDTSSKKHTGSKKLSCYSFRKRLRLLDNEDLNLRNILSNLRYTCVSMENINSQEEIETIEKNIDENDKLRRY